MSSYPTRDRKFQKNSKKIQKIKKHHHSFYSIQISWKRPRKGENKKKNRFDEFLPDS